MPARLVEIRGGRRLGETPLSLPEILIGRDPSVDLQFPLDSVSRQHALIRRVKGGHELSDLGSANGTALNGRPISRPVPLEPGDRIELADAVTLIYEVSGFSHRIAVALAVLLIALAAGGAAFWWSTRPDPTLARAAALATEAVAAWERGDAVSARKGLQSAAGLLYANGYLDRFQRARVIPEAFAMIEPEMASRTDLSALFEELLERETARRLERASISPITPDISPSTPDIPESPPDTSPSMCRLDQMPPEQLDGCLRSWVQRVLTGLRQDAQYVPDGFYRAVGERMRRERAFLESALERGVPLVPMLTHELEEANMPPLLHYLALIESGYRPHVKSKAGARGLWQFMPKTARHYGLTVSSKLDERRDPEKSTRAAARYLRDLAFEFGGNSLLLALAGYNRGENGVRGALKRLDDPFSDRSYWRLVEANLLPKETALYVPRFMAAAVAGEGGLPGQATLVEAGY